MNYEWRLVLIVLAVACAATAGQSWEPAKGMVRVPLALPLRASQEVVVAYTNKGLCKVYNHSATKCEIYYD